MPSTDRGNSRKAGNRFQISGQRERRGRLFSERARVREESATSRVPVTERAHTPHGFDRCRTFFSVAEPKKEKTEQSANGAISPSGGEPQAANLGSATTGSAAPVSGPVPEHGNQQKPNRPNTLDARVVARRLILFDSEYHMERRSAFATRLPRVDRRRSEKSPDDVLDRVSIDNRSKAISMEKHVLSRLDRKVGEPTRRFHAAISISLMKFR